MDTKQLIKDAKARFKHNSAKAYLKDKYQSKLIVADQDGLWLASPELIGFLSGSRDDYVVLVDRYNNPVQVDRIELLEKLDTVYNGVMSMWFTEWQELKSNR